VGCALSRAEPHVERRKGIIYTKHRRQTLDEIITAYIGLDAHAESTAIAVAEAGSAAPRFIGTVGAKFSELSKALGKLGESESLRIVYEAGTCGFATVRQLQGGQLLRGGGAFEDSAPPERSGQDRSARCTYHGRPGASGAVELRGGAERAR